VLDAEWRPQGLADGSFLLYTLTANFIESSALERAVFSWGTIPHFTATKPSAARFPRKSSGNNS